MKPYFSRTLFSVLLWVWLAGTSNAQEQFVELLRSNFQADKVRVDAPPRAAWPESGAGCWADCGHQRVTGEIRQGLGEERFWVRMPGDDHGASVNEFQLRSIQREPQQAPREAPD